MKSLRPRKVALKARASSLIPVWRRSLRVDNECARGAILPRPIVLDGHHRLVAARALQVPLIAVHYGGRIDVLDYLTGKTDKPPE